MSGQWFVGRTPDSDSSELPKSYVDAQLSSLLVTTGYVNAQIATAATALVGQTYVDNGDNALAHKAAVDAADLNYVAANQLNVANGVAGMGSTGQVQPAQIPGNVPLEYTARAYNAATDGHINLASNATQLVTTSTLREYQLATITIADPGFPWLALPFGFVQGGDPTAPADPGRTMGTGNFGLLSVLPPTGVSDQIYGVGLCTATYRYDFYKVHPYATTNQLPAPIHGGLSLGLYGCCWTGAEYTFTGNGLMFWVLMLPAMGT